MTLKSLLLFTYRVHSAQLLGPSWIDDEGFDIVATTTEPVSRPQLRQMLQAMLDERFKLRIRREEQDVPVYRLVVATGGPRLLTETEGAEMLAALQREGKPPMKPGFAVITKPCDMSEFAERLGRPLDRPVVDNTGVEGRFWCHLAWKPDPAPEGVRHEGPQPLLYAGPSLRAALEDQMRLELDSTIALIEMLIVDHAERPAFN